MQERRLPARPMSMSECFKAFTPHRLGDEICRKERNLTEVCWEQRFFTTSVLFASRSYRDARSQGVTDLSEYLIAGGGGEAPDARRVAVAFTFAFAAFVSGTGFK